MMSAVTTARSGMSRPVRQFMLVVSCCTKERSSAGAWASGATGVPASGVWLAVMSLFLP